MKKLVSVCLLLALLTLAACDTGGAEEPVPEATVVEVATPTSEAVVPSEGITGTEAITGTGEMTGTEGLTETESLTEGVGVTDTSLLTESEGLTETGSVTGAAGVTPTTGMTETEGITQTEGTTETVGIETAPRQLIRASDLQDYTVQNANGENLGNVQDLVFNLDTGQIVLVTIEYGGFLDIGDKVFPIPLSAFRFVPMTEAVPAVPPVAAPGAVVTETTGVTDTTAVTTTEPIVSNALLILDIPEETFKNAPGFADDFPVLTDPATIGEIEAFYRNLGEEVIGRPIAETDLEALAGRAVKLSDLEDGNVQNPAGEDLGEIQDILIDLRAGRVEYFILSFGGFLGIGDKEYAIPTDAFEVIPTSADVEAGAPELVLNTTEEQLEEAPVFNEVDLGNPDWDLDVRHFWPPDAK